MNQPFLHRYHHLHHVYSYHKAYILQHHAATARWQATGNPWSLESPGTKIPKVPHRHAMWDLAWFSSWAFKWVMVVMVVLFGCTQFFFVFGLSWDVSTMKHRFGYRSNGRLRSRDPSSLTWPPPGIPFEGFDRESPLPSPRYFQALVATVTWDGDPRLPIIPGVSQKSQDWVLKNV